MTHTDAISSHASERYLLDEMSELERHEFEEHFFDCDICAADVRAGAHLADGIRREALQTTPNRLASTLPARVVPFKPRGLLNAAWPLAAAAAVSLVAGYQSLVTIPALRAKLAPQLVAPIVLTPATRGETPVLDSSQTPGAQVLSLDVTLSPSSGQLDYDLRTDGGRRVVAGRQPAPLPGTPLLVLLADPLPPGDYVVTLAEAEGPGDRVSTYRFAVK